MRSRLSKGLIIPTAMFVAMFVLLLVTCIMASVSYNFDMSLRSVENTEFRYTSFATANELISSLNGTATITGDYQTPPVRDGELKYDTYTKDDPWVINEDGRITETCALPATLLFVLLAEIYSSQRRQLFRHTARCPCLARSLFVSVVTIKCSR